AGSVIAASWEIGKPTLTGSSVRGCAVGFWTCRLVTTWDSERPARRGRARRTERTRRWWGRSHMATSTTNTTTNDARGGGFGARRGARRAGTGTISSTSAASFPKRAHRGGGRAIIQDVREDLALAVGE